MDKIERLLEEVFAAGSDFATGVNGGGDRQSFQNYANAAIAKARAEFTRLENVNYTWSQRFVTLIKENETLKVELADKTVKEMLTRCNCPVEIRIIYPCADKDND